MKMYICNTVFLKKYFLSAQSRPVVEMVGGGVLANRSTLQKLYSKKFCGQPKINARANSSPAEAVAHFSYA